MQFTIAIIALVGFAACAVAAYFRFRHHAPWARVVLLAGGLTGLAANAFYFTWSIHQRGSIETFRHNFESWLLLSSIIGVVAMTTYVSGALRGLDGFLFLAAAIVELGALAIRTRTKGADVTYQPWFISHSVAFGLSGACFIAGGLAGIAYLIINNVLRKRPASTLVGAVAPLESLERFGRWMLMIGFPLFTYGVLTGVCQVVQQKMQRENPGPGAWIWDPTILLSFVTWVAYALLVGSMLLTPQVRGRRAATLATCGMGLVALVFLVLEFVSPYHR